MFKLKYFKNKNIKKNNFSKIKKINKQFMKDAGLSKNLIKEFIKKLKQFYQNKNFKINWAEVEKLNLDDIVFLTDIEKLNKNKNSKIKSDKEILDKLVVIKLNGGLGTTMGLEKPKTLIKLQNSFTILEIIIKQIRYLRKKFNTHLPLIFMNSFYTNNETNKIELVKNINSEINIKSKFNFLKKNKIIESSFLQNKVPRIFCDTLLPCNWNSFNKNLSENKFYEKINSENYKNNNPINNFINWCPPGHADVFFSLYQSKLIDKLISQNFEIAFISNGDNIASTPDLDLLKYILDNKIDWVSEVTPKTNLDKKGGVYYKNKKASKINLLEIAQVEPDFINNFYDTNLFPYFNVNSIWINLKALKNKIKRNKLHFPIIVNKKIVFEKEIVQLEGAMGAGISNFKKSKVVVVGRERFMPIKNCSDLLRYKSDIYDFDKEKFIFKQKNLDQILEIILPKEFQDLSKFEEFFQVIPSLVDANYFKLEGELIFDIKIKIIGSVEFKSKTNGAIKKVSDLNRKVFENELVEY